MKARSIWILSTLGLFGLVLAAHSSHAQGLAPGAAAPPLATLDLTKPGSPRPSAVTQQAAPPTAAAAPAPALRPPAAKAPPTTVKAVPAKAKPGTVASTTPTKKTTTKAPPKAAKGKPAPKPTTQTATANDR